MRTSFLGITGIIIFGVILVSIIGIQEYQNTYNQDCTTKNGKIVGFLKCVRMHEDFGLSNPFTVNLKFGETFQYEELGIKFFEIEDSRCPLDVACVWEGNVNAMFKVSNKTHDISSGPIPIEFTIDFIDPYEITLKNIEPHPISSEKSNYVAILEIKKLTNSSDGKIP